MKNYKGSICRIEKEEVLQLISDLEQHKLVRYHEDVKLDLAHSTIKWTTTKSNPIYQTLKFIIDQQSKLRSCFCNNDVHTLLSTWQLSYMYSQYVLDNY